MNDDQMAAAEARLREQRERVVDEIKKLDAMLAEFEVREPHGPLDVLTHAIVVTSWHRMEGEGPDSVGMASYRVTDMAEWQVLGLLEAEAAYTRRTMLEAADPDDHG
jgi:hypothetical protein